MKFEDDTPEPGSEILPYPRNPPINLPRNGSFLQRDDLFTFEGVDGSGKSTLVKAVAAATARRRREARVLKLNGSDVIRHALERAKWLNTDPMTFSLLNWVSLFHQSTVSLPTPGDALLFFDRYTLTIKTRGILEGLETDFMDLLEARLPIPKKIFLVDCDPEICLARVVSCQRVITYFEAGSRMVSGTGAQMVEPDESLRGRTGGRETRMLEYLHRMRATYLELARSYSNVVLIDNSGPLEASLARVLEHLGLPEA
ncbi:MAG: hypothetical protein ACJ76N_06180 [Thermoanaerobaculia bacterium]